MCLGECEIRSTTSFAFSLATYPICLQASAYWFASSSSSVSSCCSSECSSTCVVLGNGRYIHILPCTASMCAGADWGGCCNLTGLDVLWRFGEAQVDTVRAVQTQIVFLCICPSSILLEASCGNDILNKPVCCVGEWLTAYIQPVIYLVYS